MRLLKQSSTAQPLLFLLVDSTDHVTGKTGLTPTVTLSKSGAAFGAPAGAVTEIANGWYKVAGNATDTNTLGPLVLHATGTGADPVDIEYAVVAFDPQDAAGLGLSRVDAAITTRLAPTVAARTLDVSVTGEAGLDWANIGSPTTTVGLSGTTVKTATDVETDTQDIQSRLPASLGANGNIKADARDWLGTALPASDTAGYPKVTVKVGTGTGELALTNGGIIVENMANPFATALMEMFVDSQPGGYGLTDIAQHLVDLKGAGWVTGDNLHSRLDAAVSSRMATFTYTAPDNTTITAINAKTTLLTASVTNTANIGSTNIVNVANSLAAMIAANKYTAPALENAPGGGGGGSSITSNTQIGNLRTSIG